MSDKPEWDWDKIKRLQQENERLTEKYRIIDRLHSETSQALAQKSNLVADLTVKLEAAVGPCHACRSAVNTAYIECPHSAIGRQADHIRQLESLLREAWPWQLPPSLQDRIKAALDEKMEVKQHDSNS